MSYLDLMCTLYLRLFCPCRVTDNARLCRKWFLQSLGVQQFHKLLAGFENKAAQAVCTFAYCEGPGHEPIVFQGRTAVRRRHSTHRFHSIANCRSRARSWKPVGRLISVRNTSILPHSRRDLTLTLARLGRMLRVRRPDVRRDAQGREEQDFSPRQSPGEARRVA
jgi:hypothetical protein